MKKRLFTGLLIFLGIVLIVGVTAVAVTSYGSKENPLVTKSYIDKVAKDEIVNSSESVIDEKAKELEDKLNKTISGFQVGENVVPASFETVTLKSNEVIRCSMGSELIVRSGKATCYGNSPWLIDTTTGVALEKAGAEMTNNHMYFVAYERNGLRARADDTVVLVSGTYTVYDNL